MYRYGSAGGFWLGVIFFVIGLLITGVSFIMAASNSGGGTYYVSYGFIILGLIRMATGLPALLNSRKQPTRAPGQPTGFVPPNHPGQPMGYPPQQPGYPPQQPGYPPQQPGYPGQQPYYPSQQPGYPPQQPGYGQPAYPPQYGSYGGNAPASQGQRPGPYGAPAAQSQHPFATSKPCWNCGHPVAGNPTVCPDCGAPQSTPTA